MSRQSKHMLLLRVQRHSSDRMLPDRTDQLPHTLKDLRHRIDLSAMEAARDHRHLMALIAMEPVGDTVRTALTREASTAGRQLLPAAVVVMVA